MSEGRLKGVPEEEMDDVYRIIGLGALKYFILKVDPRKNMLFNPQESIDFNGNTGPFVQYTYARIRSVLRKSDEADAATDITAYEPNEKEIEIIQRIVDFPSVVSEAGRTYSPALIANYVFELAKGYNQFYHDYSILKEENGVARAPWPTSFVAASVCSVWKCPNACNYIWHAFCYLYAEKKLFTFKK